MQSQLVPSFRPTWGNVLPAGAPECSQGAPYSFWVRQGDPTKIAVVLSGGGACSTGENCGLHGKPFCRPFAGLELDSTTLGGMFDTDNPENPLHDCTVVYLLTGIGDLFLGDLDTTYDVPAMGGQSASKINILDEGYTYGISSLDWTFKPYRDHPKTVAVMGWSSGAMALLIYTHIVAENYSDASDNHFADGGSAYPGRRKTCAAFQVMGDSEPSQEDQRLRRPRHRRPVLGRSRYSGG